MCNWWPCCGGGNNSNNIRRFDHDGNVIWSKKIEEGSPIYKVMAFSGSTPLYYYVHSLMTIPRVAKYDMTDQSTPMWSANANYLSQQIFGPSGGTLTLVTIVDFEIDSAGNAYVLVSGGPSTATCYVVKLNGDTGQYVWHKQLQWSIGISTFRPVCRSIAVNTTTGYSYVICDPIRRPHEPALPSVQYCNIIAVEPTGAAFQTGSTHGTPPWTTIPNAPTSVDADSNNNQIFVTLRADGSKNCAVVLNAGLSAQWSGSPGNSQFQGCVNGQSNPRRALSFGDFTLAEGIRRFYLRDDSGTLVDNASFKLMTGPISNVAIYGNRQASRNRSVDAAAPAAFYALNRVMTGASTYRTEPKVMLAEPMGGPFLYHATLDFDNANNKALCIDGFDRAPVDSIAGCLVAGNLVNG